MAFHKDYCKHEWIPVEVEKTIEYAHVTYSYPSTDFLPVKEVDKVKQLFCPKCDSHKEVPNAKKAKQ